MMKRTNTGHLRTFRLQFLSKNIRPQFVDADKDLNNILKWFWDLETVGITVKYSERIDMTTNNKSAWKKLE